MGERLGETEAQRWEAGQAVGFGVLWGMGRELGVRMGGKGGGGGGVGVRMGETEAGEWGVGSDVGKAGLRNWDGGEMEAGEARI